MVSQARQSGVVFYRCDGHEAEHERVVHMELARRLARLQGLAFLGEFTAATSFGGRLYFVPSDTVVGIEQARQLGIQTEGDLFGGVVPQPFVATKAISHPLISIAAQAPLGWSAEFNRRVADAVLFGFTAFTLADAQQAGLQVLAHGPLRIKAVLATAGKGQWLVQQANELAEVLAGLDAAEIARVGLVLEEHLEQVQTYSIGQVRVGGLVASYYGAQRLTLDNAGAGVYGGSDLVVVRGDFEALSELELPVEIRLAIQQAQAYDAAAHACFPGLLASRRNYDVATGVNAQGQRRSGVLEQSWRIGGASSAEVVALEMLQAAPECQEVHASAFEVYGRQPDLPANATRLFSGIDPEVGAITKFVTAEPCQRMA